MQKLTFDFEQQQIEINGHVFDILRSDADILKIAAALEKKFNGIEAEAFTAQIIVDATAEVHEHIESILGEGALEKISGGKPVSIVKAVQILMEIVKTCVNDYSGYIAKEYA